MKALHDDDQNADLSLTLYMLQLLWQEIINARGGGHPALALGKSVGTADGRKQMKDSVARFYANDDAMERGTEKLERQYEIHGSFARPSCCAIDGMCVS